MLSGILVIMVGCVYLRLRGSTIVKPRQKELDAGQITIYQQNHEKWADNTLGDSSFTMQSSGCLVTCIASAISSETGEAVTPGRLNEIFSQNHVYDAEGNIQWAAIDEMEGYTAVVFPDVAVTEIESCLENEHYPIVRVRMHGLGNFHYVLIVGIADGEYICMDPLESKLTKLSRYLDRVYAVRMVYPL